jgi:hypothetical protein
MLSIETCEKLLTQKEKKYTKEQIKQIRETLYILGNIAFDNFLKKHIK